MASLNRYTLAFTNSTNRRRASSPDHGPTTRARNRTRSVVWIVEPQYPQDRSASGVVDEEIGIGLLHAGHVYVVLNPPFRICWTRWLMSTWTGVTVCWRSRRRSSPASLAIPMSSYVRAES